MLNIGRLSPGAADYYVGEVAASPEDYYAGHGESAGRWMGSLSSSIGLHGEVDAADFRSVLTGYHPMTSEQLVIRAGGSLGEPRRDQARLLPDQAIDVPRAAARLRLSVRHLRRLLWAGERPPSGGPDAYLLGERAPGRGRPWRIAASEIERYEAASARRRGRPGFDLTLRPPKSVSLLWALGSDEIRKAVWDAHHEAVSEVVRYVERHALYARRWRVGKQERVLTDGLIAAAFDHRTSRAGDPLLHTHVVVANLTRTVDGDWHALDARPLYEHARPAGVLYQAHLRTILSERLGVRWEAVRNGWAEIAGLPKDVIRAFSKRREEIKDLAAESGYTSASALQAATLSTREAKGDLPETASLLDRWREEADELGFDWEALQRALGHGATTVEVDGDRLFGDLACSQGLTKHASSFARRDVVEAIGERTGASARADDIERLADAFLASELVLPIAPTGQEWVGRRGGGVDRDGDLIRWTTPELVSMEGDLLSWADSHSGDSLPTTVVDVDSALGQHPYLSDEQRVMVRALVGKVGGVQPVAGRPGAGKTTATAVYVEALASSGVPVVGCAIAATAAAELEHACRLHERTGRAASTIARLLNELTHRPLDPGTVVIVDEASMVGTRDLHRLGSHVAACGGSLKLIGDPDQHGAVEAGGFFRTLVERSGDVVVLIENNRQDDAEDRLAIDQFREGNVEGALSRYEAARKVVRSVDAAASRQRLVADWWELARAGGTDPMISGTNSVRRRLNALARAEMVEAGLVSGPSVALDDGREFAAGDWIVTRRNQSRLRAIDGHHVKNGDAGRVVAADPDEGSLLVSFDYGTVRLPRWYVSSFVEHGYARTTYGVQGATLDHALVHVDDRTGFEEAYVAFTRGRTETRLYLVDGSIDDVEEEVSHRAHERIPTGLDTVAQTMQQRRAGVLVHDLDALADAGLDAFTTNLSTIASQRRAVERVLAAGPPDVSDALLEQQAAVDDLIAQRRALAGAKPKKLERLERCLDRATARLTSIEQQQAARAAFLRAHADEVADLQRLRRLELAREAIVRAEARAQPPAGLAAAARGASAIVEQTVLDTAELVAVHLERHDAAPDALGSDPVRQMIGDRPVGDGLAQISYDGVRRAIEAIPDVTAQRREPRQEIDVADSLF